MYFDNDLDNVRRLLDLIKVYDCDIDKIRIGPESDGGYVLSNHLSAAAPELYSFGIGNDVQFELDFAKKYPTSIIKLFDASIDTPPVMRPQFSFSKRNMNKLFQFGEVPLGSTLKMDIEWDEWEGLYYTDPEVLQQFSQLIIEFHLVDIPLHCCSEKFSPYFSAFYRRVLSRVNNELFGMYCEVLQKITRDFYIFHIHANNSLPKVMVEGLTFPPLLEMSFISKSLPHIWGCSYASSLAQYIKPPPLMLDNIFPVEGLDFPNKIDRPDIKNWYPLLSVSKC